VLSEGTEYKSTEVVDGAGNYLNSKNCCCIESQSHIFYLHISLFAVKGNRHPVTCHGGTVGR